MLALKFPDTKDLMKKLLTGDTFDTFLLSEASVTTFTTFVIDGTWHPDYYEPSSESPQQAGGEAAPSALSWKLVRPIVFQIIKGRHTPNSFRIVLRLADYNTEHLLHGSGLSIDPSQVGGLFLNLSYQNGEASCTTGTSMKIFTLDKSLDRIWDDMVIRFFRSRQIIIEQL
jgi:hypothetical protein